MAMQSSKTIILREIRQSESGVYDVGLAEAENEQPRRFRFQVEEGDIQVLTWTNEFAEYMNHNLGPVKRLLEAILAFHRAQKISIPGAY
jgi:hypothetical protein